MAQSADLTLCDKKGSEVSLYLNIGSCDTPIWIYHKGVTGDLNLTDSEDEDELSVRDPAQLVKQYVGGKFDIEIAAEQVLDIDYEGCAFINSMRSNGSAGDVAFLSGLMTDVGSFGWRGMMRNFEGNINGPEQGAGAQSFRLKPAACVLEECKMRPIRVDVADAIVDYDPGEFTPTGP
jgi:hypothetical protein